MLTGKKVEAVVKRMSRASDGTPRRAPPASDRGEEGVAESPQDYFPCWDSAPERERKAPPFSLPLASALDVGEPDDLSACSDLESGVADLSSRSSSSGNDKDPDLYEAAYATA